MKTTNDISNEMIHQQFVDNVIKQIKDDNLVIGLALGGSWITNEIDKYSDIDMILVTSKNIPPDVQKMTEYAQKFGNLLNGFTGEHVGESRVLICLYDNPLLHVDIKFITTDEFFDRIENPVIIWERDKILTTIIENSDYKFPYPNYQWIEDRFWIWIHYVCLKIGRGELFEALDFTSFLRTTVLASLIQIKNGYLPKGLRKVEMLINDNDLERLKKTVAQYSRASIIDSLQEIILLYQDLRKILFSENIKIQSESEKRSLNFFVEIKNKTA